MRKRFVKLLLFKVDTQYRLLYGFSSETEQSSYVVRGIQHYIVDDGAQTKIVWANGNFECRICGDISEEEAIAIIDSIYKDG